MTGSVCQLRLRLLAGQMIALGPGKVDLLEAVLTQGSISEAARHMGMSYRRAWQLIDTMNRCFPGPLVETTKGGEKGGGATLSVLGREVLERYRRIERLMLAAAHEDLRALEDLLDAPSRALRSRS